ncbi:MAG: DMT family transporter [Thermoplasmata archaeon]|jgi:drug/metabolite transporter (DMT)-like permease|nr:DMT family transporter [Thermoplasmata archaeon]
MQSVDVSSDSGVRNRATAFTLLAAFLWATYYPFVLAVQHHATPSATIVYPFLLGGALYSAYAIRQGQGGAWAHLWLTPGAWVRVGFLVGMQLSVLAATYLIGPVDASLLSLIGDVVLTPVLVAFVWAHHRGHLGTWTFRTGLVLSLLGGGLTIAGGHTLSAVVGAGWLVVPAIPITVAVYFLLCAKENERTPPLAVVSQSMLAAGVVGIPLSLLLPGGVVGLATIPPVSLALLAVVGVTSFALAPLLYFRAIQDVGMVIPPMLMTGIPVFTLLLSATVLHLGLPLVAALGVPIAIGGAVLTLRGEAGVEAPPRPASTN